jgi:hypothetical protein
MYADVTICLARMEFDQCNQLLASAGMSFVESSRETLPENTFAGRHHPEELHIMGVLNSSHGPKRCTLRYGPNYLSFKITMGLDAKVTEDVKRTFTKHITGVFPP